MGIPNFLTSFRIVLAGVFPFAPVEYHTAIILVALVTEFLDGQVARALHCTSEWGETLDPIADKLFFGSVCLTWISLGRIAPADLFLLGVRDIGIACIVVFLALTGRLKATRMIRPTPLSKLTTVMQYVAFFPILRGDKPPAALVWLTFALGLFALLQYAVMLARRENK